MLPGDVSAAESRSNAAKLSEFTRIRDVVFIYSLVLRNNKIHFTASSATDEELNSGEGITYYFDHYEDVAPEVFDVFNSQKKSYLEFTDQWGTFRSVFIPMRAEDGSMYVTSADIETSHIDTLLRNSLLQQVTIAALFLFFAIPLVIAFSFASRRQAQELEIRIKERTLELSNSEATLSSILEHSPIGIVHYNEDGRLLKVNKAFEKITGKERSSLINTPLIDVLDNGKLKSAVRTSLAGQSSELEEETCFSEQQCQAMVHASFAPMRSRRGTVTGAVAVFDDRTEQNAALLKLRKLSMAVESSPNVVFITNRNGEIEYVNPRFTDITGYTPEDVQGKTPRILKSGDRNDTDYESLWLQILDGKSWSGEFKNHRKNGEAYWARQSIAPIRDNNGEITHFVAIQEDITEERRVHEENRYFAIHDMLTGLINRMEFERRLARVVSTAKQSASHHALCFVDLDQFKIINDTCGHVAGDELLRQLATQLKSSLRQRDTLARIGGDEFALLMEHCDLEQAQKVVNNIHRIIDEFVFCWEEHNFTIGSSIGLTAIDEYTPGAIEVLKQADTACYMAKERGRNRVHIYRQDDESVARREGEMQWVNVLKRALSDDRLRLFAQIIEPTADSGVRPSYEVLVRLMNERGELVPPGSFLPAAERYNLSSAIDDWVIQHAFAWIQKHLAQLDHIEHFSINLSGQSLGDESFLSRLRARLEESKIPARKICFEITETAAIANLSVASQFIAILRQQGCHFSLDDFGSGLSSFAYLKNLPVDHLKIDGMFVKDILDDPIDEAMVKSINDIGQIMQMKTVAEFVESAKIRARLETIGVDFVQGYAVGKPAPLESILKPD